MVCETMQPDLYPYHHSVNVEDRSHLKGHQSLVLWMTGLSGSGKSTIANALELELVRTYRVHTYLLDGDNIRTGLNAGLGFSEEDRKENIRRVSEVAKLMTDAGLIVITAFISPFRADRNMARSIIKPAMFWEVYVSCPLALCIQRDPKGLYKKAMHGSIRDFTGVSSPYEAPENPEILLDTAQLSVLDCVNLVVHKLLEKHIMTPVE